MYTTIKLRQETKKILDLLKLNPRESYEDVLWDLIEDHLELNPKFKKGLERAVKEYKEGKIIPIEDIIKEMGP